MSEAKTEILARIRRAQAANPVPVPVINREYRQESEDLPGSDCVLEVFKDALEDYNAHVQVVPAAQVPEAITKALGKIGSVVVPDGLEESWMKVLRKGAWELFVDSKDKPLSTAELDRIDAVLTASRCAVSHTGTIMLDGQPDQGRRALSLVPDTHVVVVRSESVFPTVPQAVRLLALHPHRPTTWIAGPSATSDIELIRVDGVHGPRNLFVIIAT